MIEIKLPNFEKVGGTSLLIMPTLETALLRADGTVPVQIGIGGNCVTLQVGAGRDARPLPLSDQEALDIAHAILNKLYYLRGRP